MRLKHIPVVVRLYPKEMHRSDLMAELKVDRHNIDAELRRQPARYMFWAALYSSVAAKADMLQEKLDQLEAGLFRQYSKKARRVTDIRQIVSLNHEYQILRASLRRWRSSERLLKYGVRAFEQRKDILMAYNANLRAEKKVAEED